MDKNLTIISDLDFFYSEHRIFRWVITQNIVDSLKELNHTFEQGGYVEKKLCYLLEDNHSILDKYRGELQREEFLSHIRISQQLIIRMIRPGDIPNSVFLDLNIKDSEIPEYYRLFGNLYIDFDEWTLDRIETGDKRPFGNSHIEGDISFVFGDKPSGELWKIYDNILELAIWVFKNYPINFRSFEKKKRQDLNSDQIKYYSNNCKWVPDISEFRDKKIEKILS